MPENPSTKPDRTSKDTGILFDSVIKLLNKAASIEKEPVDIGGVYLHASEVHLIDIFGRFPDEGMSDAAKRLGITKGAVSQTALKLEKKGCIKRVKAGEDGKKINAVLTESGEKACLWHKNYHDMMNKKISEFADKMDDESFGNLIETLSEFENLFDSCLIMRKKSLALTENKKI
nr:MarR family winged helix-turn-helix transcriptional regulator [Methanomicrobium sp. W14]